MAPHLDAGESVLLDPSSVLCCFAVKPEARFLSDPRVPRLITGIGPHAARRALETELQRKRPTLVLSCGFAGGLNPGYAAGTVLFQADEESGLGDLLAGAGACPARFCTSDRILVTVEEKQVLRSSSGADAVEMESEAIRSYCLQVGIPSATIRAVSDSALEDLPLDFNRLLTARHGLNYGRLCAQLLGAPGRVPALLRLQRRATLAAKNLAAVLNRILGGYPPSGPPSGRPEV